MYLTFPKYTAFEKATVPLFVSRTAIFGPDGPGSKPGKKLPRARGRWALDSGGFLQITNHGRYTFTPEQYVHDVRRCVAEIGNLDWASTMDYMCEDAALERSGLTVQEHQWLTIESYQRLMKLAPDLAHLWVPVLQGHDPADYPEHFGMWLAAGIDLRQANVVGVGSVCRRAETTALRDIFQLLRGLGLRRLHGFGVKESGFDWSGRSSELAGDLGETYWRALEVGYPVEELLHPGSGATWEENELPICRYLWSADSNAWADRARKQNLEVWLARQAVAVARGHDPAAAKDPSYCRDVGGIVYFGTERAGPVRLELAGKRTGSLPFEERAFLPTQMLKECAVRRAAWKGGKGAGREPHASCSMCMPWALVFRDALRRQVEPQGCWDEKPFRRPLPPVSTAWHEAHLAAAGRAQDEFERFGPERFAHLSDMPKWAAVRALRHRVDSLRRRVDAGDEGAILELHQARLELAAATGRLDLPPEE